MLSDEEYLNHGDPRISVFPLMDNPKPTFGLTAAYLVFVTFIGPKLMKNRKAYELKLPMFIYNISLVLVNGWISWNLASLGWLTKYNWRCEPIDFSNNEDAVKIAFVCWIFYLSKFVEFADTVFFILRKKENQVSKLHVFHHCQTPLFIWYSIKYGPGGYTTLFYLLNASVHVFMYMYYGLSGLGPTVQKYLWWKKYLTSLQLLQFIIMIYFVFSWYFFPPAYCRVSTFLVKLQMFEAVVFFVLFSHFYLNTYPKKHQKVRKVSTP